MSRYAAILAELQVFDRSLVDGFQLLKSVFDNLQRFAGSDDDPNRLKSFKTKGISEEDFSFELLGVDYMLHAIVIPGEVATMRLQLLKDGYDGRGRFQLIAETSQSPSNSLSIGEEQFNLSVAEDHNRILAELLLAGKVVALK